MHTRLSLALALLPLALAPLCPARAQTATPQAVTKPTFTVLHSFTAADGENPVDNLTVGADGALYGVTPFGGAADGGTIFKVTQGGLFHKLADLYEKNGREPDAPLLLMPGGALMGSTFLGGASNTGALFLLTPPNRFQTKHEFSGVMGGSNTRGAQPDGPLALGPDGAVYGTTYSGGSGGSGVVYRWTAAHGVEVLYDFGASDFVQGNGVTLGPDGALYGTTYAGGTSDDGTVFRLTTDGVFSVLHSFGGPDGVHPTAPPVIGPDGALYGIAFSGGTHNDGTAYRITTDGAFSLVYTFLTDGGYGLSGLTSGPDGNLYGTTRYGGPKGGGAVFRLSPAGKFAVVYAFTTQAHMPTSPAGGVTFEPDGALYGTTSAGGKYGQSGNGTVFRLRLPQ